MLKIQKFSDSQQAAQGLGCDLSLKLSEAKTKRSSSLLLFSGGSALSVLDYIDNNVLGDYLTVGVLDERYDPTNQNNNFTQLTKTIFFRRAKKAKINFIDTSVKRNQTQQQLAEYFEKSLREWKKRNKNGIILATVGMGEDGHIAGIMPFINGRHCEAEGRSNPEDKGVNTRLLRRCAPRNDTTFQKLFCGRNWVAAYEATNKNPHPLRVTTTITFLKLINHGFTYICGQEKTTNLKKIASPGKISELPCRALKQLKNLIIYTDNE